MKIKFWAIVFACLLPVLSAGCSHTHNLIQDIQNTSAPSADANELARGDDAFHNNDFQKALEIYSSLSQLSKDDKIRRKALYGMACTRLIMADNVNDLNEAIILFDTWSQLLPTDIETEDPRMLKPVILRKALPGVTEERIKKRSNTSKNKENLKQLEAKDSEILRLQTRVKEMAQEIQTLKRQISSLEAIDQKIQEKKKEITSE